MRNQPDTPLILAIDNGTQSIRALLFDLHGRLVAKSQIPLKQHNAPRPGWAEQDPAYFWDSLCAACRQLWAQDGVTADAVAGVAVTTQRGTVLCVDENGRALRPAILWLDQRRTEGQPAVGGLWGLAFRLANMRDTVAYVQAEAEANWIRIHQPDIWRQTDKILLLSGYLTHRLTGRMADSVGCQVAYLPFDYKKKRWAADWDWKWRALPMRREMLPDLVEPGQTIGHITADAAAQTGIPAGLPLVAAAADKACEVLGSGCLEPHMGGLSYGTTATVNATHRRYSEVIPLIPPYPAAVPDAYSLEVQIYRGYWMVSWFKQQFGHAERQTAAQQGISAEEIFDDLIADIPAGSMGLMLQPFWSPGIRVPGPEAKGSIIGFGDVHTKGHVYRAILEGIAYALREGAERIGKRSRVPITELRVSCDGSQSEIAMQITADVFGMPAARPHVYETSGLGAAVVAAVGLGLHPDFDTAVRTMTHVGDVFDPDPATHRLYDRLYTEVYKEMYGRLQPLYESIRDITGYPA